LTPPSCHLRCVHAALRLRTGSCFCGEPISWLSLFGPRPSGRQPSQPSSHRSTGNCSPFGRRQISALRISFPRTISTSFLPLAFLRFHRRYPWKTEHWRLPLPCQVRLRRCGRPSWSSSQRKYGQHFRRYRRPIRPTYQLVFRLPTLNCCSSHPQHLPVRRRPAMTPAAFRIPLADPFFLSGLPRRRDPPLLPHRLRRLLRSQRWHRSQPRRHRRRLRRYPTGGRCDPH